MAKIDSLDKQNTAFAKTAGNARSRLRYLRFARWLRMPSQSYALWQPGLLIVSAGAAAVFGFIASDLMSFSGSTSLCLVVIIAIFALGVVGVFFHYPSDTTLPVVIGNAEFTQHDFEGRLAKAASDLDSTRDLLESLSKERAQILKSVEWQRAALLNRDWRAMRDEAWEDYLVEVFAALGASPRRTGRTGDQGVDLVVQWGNRCIAVQAKGYYHAVSNKAVQEAVAGQAHYQCTSTAVITNSRFTRGAIELAQSNNCALIGEIEFPDFVMGKLSV
ncbi:MAG TPA: restriction endonuclease [Lacipirellulaceae bacterium]|nr:restriction endonuclease [Lacipirellulaceae bacterium]